MVEREIITMTALYELILKLQRKIDELERKIDLLNGMEEKWIVE